MTAAATKRRRQTERRESCVYAGNRLMGTIKPKANGFAARSAAGQALGDFPDERSAMAAISNDDRMRLQGGAAGE
jgi:hypothetical protein